MSDFSWLASERHVLAVASHDAGGAEILSSLLRRHGLNAVFVLEGPAKAIFEKKLGPLHIVSLDEAIEHSDVLLCSTSWQSDLECISIKKFKEAKKITIAYLDHWVNYQARFERNGVVCLPDAIWVGDAIAHNMAKEVFQSVPIHLVKNPYFLDIKEEIKKSKQPKNSPKGLVVLYVCEPIKEHARLRYGDERYWGYVEEEALRYFLNNLQALGQNIREIRIRPHPSESRDKYDWIFKEFDLPIVTVGNAPLISDIVTCDIVVGCESMAMVVGLLASKFVISCIPPAGRKCVLPHQEIAHISQFVNNK